MAENCWVVPTPMYALVGEITMPLSVREAAHVVRDTAEDPRNNIAKIKRIFFIRPPCRFVIVIYTLWRNESIVAFRILLSGCFGKGVVT